MIPGNLFRIEPSVTLEPENAYEKERLMTGFGHGGLIESEFETDF